MVYDRQGHLVESHKSVPPGVRKLPTGPHRGDIIETPSEGYRDGGFLQKGGARKDEDYNMKRALELGYKPDEDGHYPSVDHETGMLLKSTKHPTVKLEFISQMLSPKRKLVANPTGYFGEYQLQYVDRKQKGGKLEEKSGMSPEEYSKEYDKAVEKYGEDVGLAFDPQTGTFRIGNQMLPTAEVEAKVDRDKSGNPIFKSEMAKDRYYANKNLGEAGGKQMKEVQNAINEARGKFAEDYMMPAIDAVMMATGAGEAVALGRGAAMLGRGALKLGAKGAKNLYKINPFATKSIPSKADHYYRVVPGKAYDDLVESGVVRARSTQAPEGASLLEQMKYRPTSRASFAKGKAMPEYGKGDPRAVVIEAGPREGAWMNRATKKNPVTGKRTPRPSGRHFADFALDPKTGKMTDIPKSDVTNVYRATPHFLKGYEKLPYLKGGVKKDPVVGTGKKPKGSGRRLYTDENPKDTVSIKFATPADARATVSKVKNINKPFARKIQILTVGEQRAKVMGKDEVVSIFKSAKESLRARNKKFLKRK